MRFDTQCEPAFARHETFFPRYGWFKKAVDGAASDPGVFARDEATITLGVGKNMVRAIRFWGLATKLLAPSVRNRRELVPTVFGRTMFGEGKEAWDPYLEDPATLWLLHWRLFSPCSKVPVWWSVFNDLTALEFTHAELLKFVMSELSHVSGWEPPLSSSVEKDVDCLLRMYVPRVGERAVDDMVDCPFRQLGLIESVPGAERTYRFVVGPKPTLPPEIITAAALEFLSWDPSGGHTAVLARLATAPGGPARVFKITEDALVEAIDTVRGRWPDRLFLTSSAGASQLTFTAPAGSLATALLLAYYRQSRPDAEMSWELEAEITSGGGSLPVAATERASRVSELAANFGTQSASIGNRPRKPGRRVRRGRA